jgi:hypothetical protein
MALTLHRTGVSSAAYGGWLDYVIINDGRDVGRLYEDRHSRPSAPVVLVDHDLRQSQARSYHKRACAEPGPGQGAIPDELAEVPHRTRFLMTGPRVARGRWGAWGCHGRR